MSISMVPNRYADPRRNPWGRPATSVYLAFRDHSHSPYPLNFRLVFFLDQKSQSPCDTIALEFVLKPFQFPFPLHFSQTLFTKTRLLCAEPQYRTAHPPLSRINSHTAATFRTATLAVPYCLLKDERNNPNIDATVNTIGARLLCAQSLSRPGARSGMRVDQNNIHLFIVYNFTLVDAYNLYCLFSFFLF